MEIENEMKMTQKMTKLSELLAEMLLQNGELADRVAELENQLAGGVKPRPIATRNIVLAKKENKAMRRRFACVIADATAGCYNTPWPTFDAFVYDVGPSPESGAVFEKINPNEPYSNDNCRWRFRGQKQRGLIMETKNKTVWQKRTGGK